MKKKSFLLRIFEGALIGLGAVLPGISGGVLSVLFGVYKPLMEFLSNPFGNFKTHMPKLFPVFLGGVLGFLGVANLLAFALEKYPAPSVCLFIGLIGGMLPSLFKEAGLQGRNKNSCRALFIATTVVFLFLSLLKALSVSITPSFGWYVFCGFALALSLIAPGMSFSALLMPLNLYAPFVDGLGHLSPSVFLPGGIGALFTFALLPRFVNTLFARHYSVTFHAITGIIIAATVVIIPVDSFFLSSRSFLVNVFCMLAGLIVSSALAKPE